MRFTGAVVIGVADQSEQRSTNVLNALTSRIDADALPRQADIVGDALCRVDIGSSDVSFWDAAGIDADL